MKNIAIYALIFLGFVGFKAMTSADRDGSGAIVELALLVTTQEALDELAYLPGCGSIEVLAGVDELIA